MIVLREYQKEYIDKIKQSFKNGNKKLILCSATGSGKTIMFSYMTLEAINKGKNVLILTDRKELFTQSTSSLAKMGLTASEIRPSKEVDENNLHVGMIQTVSRRLDKLKDYFDTLDLIIIDEAHKSIFDKVFNYININTFVIGATATPHREKNQDSLKLYYSDIIQVIDTPNLIKLGNLSTPESYGVPINLKGVKTRGGDYDEKAMANKFSEIKLFHGVYDNYQRLTANKKALIFAPNVESSKELVESFSDKGLPCKHVDCYMTDEVRKDTLKWFAETSNAILSNYGILTTGFDCPSIEVVILYRATKSLPLFLQMVGRGSRVTESKNTFTILDFGNNIKTHNYWEAARVWSLDKKEYKEDSAPLKECPECYFINSNTASECVNCGFEFKKTEQELEAEIIVELQKMDKWQSIDFLVDATFKDLEMYCIAKGYSKNWVYLRLKTRQDFYDYAKFMGYKKGWVYNQLLMKNML
jgi:superfamily II DNA or RNA helicase